MDVERGRLVVLSAPSGAGKTTLVRALLQREPRLRFSISYTTRPQRPNEVPGKDYVFVNEEAFQDLVRREGFLEYARVFDHWYGTRREDVEAMLTQGHSVLLEIDWQGARQVRQRSSDALSIFILPPSLKELKRRLRGRRSDSAETVERRLKDAVGDMAHWGEFDYTVFNDEVETTAAQLAEIIAGRDGHHRSDYGPVKARAEAIVAGSSAPADC